MGVADTVRAAISKVKPGQHLTRLPGPRVLIEDPGRHVYGAGSMAGTTYVPGPYDASELAARLSQTVPTVEVAGRLDDFNLSEWDCLVTHRSPTDLESREVDGYYSGDQGKVVYSWHARYPSDLCVIYVVGSGDMRVLEAVPRNGEDQSDLPDVVILRDPDVVGSHIRSVDGLPDALAGVIKRELLPVARNRDRGHVSFRHWVEGDTEDSRLALRPFLLGPEDVILAGSYERGDDSTAWVLPSDLPDLYPWVIEALREWHTLYPSRFPLVPDWHEAADWRSADEAALAERRAQLEAEFEALLAAHEQQLEALRLEARSASDAADRYQRALLTQDGDELAEAVGCALAAFGFHVVDMDQHWPDGDRREDLRVFDDEDDPDWVAIVEVKGALGGAKETELVNFGRWAERFIVDHQRFPDARWFVINHQRRIDPSARLGPFENKPSLISTFAQSNGTVIDTRALFDMLRLVEANPDLAPAARRFLKAKPEALIRVVEDDLTSEEPA